MPNALVERHIARMTDSSDRQRNYGQPHERLRIARIANKYPTARAAAEAMGVAPPTYMAHENGSRGLTTPAAQRYAEFFGVSLGWLLEGKGIDLSEQDMDRTRRLLNLAKVSKIPAPIMRGHEANLPRRLLPVFGLASAGDDGRFLMNGQKIAEVECPPMLMGVPDAYAAYVHGESMVPRYESGETVWINPHIPPRRRDYVLAQIATDDPTIYAGYVKRFVSFGDELRLEQFNPQKELEFPRPDVISVHKIVFSGES